MLLVNQDYNIFIKLEEGFISKDKENLNELYYN